MSTMINTYHSSFSLPPVPPPIPPRMGHRGGSLLSTNTPLVKFLSAMMLLLLLLMFGGFLYMFYKLNMELFAFQISTFQINIEDIRTLKEHVWNYVENKKTVQSRHQNYFKKLKLSDRHNDRTFLGKSSKVEGRVGLPESSTIPMAKLNLDRSQSQPTNDELLTWDKVHSVLKDISLSNSGALVIHHPGYYFIHSQVTFSKSHPKATLGQCVWTQKTKKENQKENIEETKLLTSFCYLPRDIAGIPDMCTASHTGVFKLEKNEQLFVNVTDRMLVNFDLTTMELFLLRE